MDRAPSATVETQQELLLNTEFLKKKGCSSTLDNHPLICDWGMKVQTCYIREVDDDVLGRGYIYPPS